MLGMMNTFGLGMVLKVKDDMNRKLVQGQANLRGLQRTAGGTADKVVADAERMTAAMAAFQSTLKVGIGMMVGGAALMAPFALAGLHAAKTEDAMGDIMSLLVGTGMSAEDATRAVHGLSREIINMAGSTRIPLRDIEQAGYDLVSALGMDIGKGALQPAVKLAVAGMGTMQESVTTLTSLLNTYGERWGDTLTPMEKATKIGDILSAAIAGQTTTLPQLTMALKYAAGSAKTYGVSLDELAILIAQLQTKGLQGTLAGTAVTAFLRQVIKLKETVGKDSILASLDVKDATGHLRPVIDILTDMERLFGVTKGNAAGFTMTVEQGAVMQKAFGDEGKKLVDTLLGQSAAMTERLKVARETHAMDAMAAARQSSAIAMYQMMKNSISGLGIVIGEQFLPVMKAMVWTFKSLTVGVLDFAQTFPFVTRLIAGLTAGLGVVLMLSGAIKILVGAVTLMKVLFPITTIVTTLFAGGMGTLAASVWATVWPILAVSAAVAGLLYLLQKVSGVNIFGGVKDAVSSIAVPEINIPTIMQPNMAMATPGGTPVDLSGAMPTQGSGSQQTTVYNMQTTKGSTYNIKAGPGMNEEKLARTIDKHRRTAESRTPGGHG